MIAREQKRLNLKRASQLKPSFERENKIIVDMLPKLFPYNKQIMQSEMIFGKGLITLKWPLSLLWIQLQPIQMQNEVRMK
jgi:hypothetical protein